MWASHDAPIHQWCYLERKPTHLLKSKGLSTLLFILYVLHAVKPLTSKFKVIDRWKSLWSTRDWTVDRDKLKTNIDTKYADNISYLRSDESKINQVQRIVPSIFKEED